jgi:hypothetical protein
MPVSIHTTKRLTSVISSDIKNKPQLATFVHYVMETTPGRRTVRPTYTE